MPLYIHEDPYWPQFRWRQEALTTLLAAVRHQQGRLIGQMEAIGFPQRSEAVLHTLTQDVVQSSAIEGEQLDIAQVRSSVARRLGLDIGGLLSADRHVEGVVEMIMDATMRFAMPLDEERLFGWHSALFPTGRSGLHRIIAGGWRDDHSGPMQVVSGPMGRERVHFTAPAAGRLPDEMSAFLAWFASDQGIDPVLKAGLAHLWFVTVHPFEDGNGRIARAIADLGLARSENSPHRFYSMSAQIHLERAAYYDNLEQTQKGGLDVTAWLTWFLECLGRAIASAETLLAAVLRKARFWESLSSETLNPRQRAMLNRLLDGFEGKLTSSKWAKITKCSPDTALRDITDLIERDILARDAASGRSTSYSFAPRFVGEKQRDGQ